MMRELRLHALAVLREAVRDDNAALQRLTGHRPHPDPWVLYATLARTAAAALQVETDTPLDLLDIMRRGLTSDE